MVLAKLLKTQKLTCVHETVSTRSVGKNEGNLEVLGIKEDPLMTTNPHHTIKFVYLNPVAGPGFDRGWEKIIESVG